MLAPVLDWIDAAIDALTTALPSVSVVDGPLVTDAQISGADIVVVGHDMADERGTGATYEGGWHDLGTSAAQSGEARVAISVLSQSGRPVSVRDRRNAAQTLAASVLTAVIPTAGTSSLGVAGVSWAEMEGWRLDQLPTAAGNVAQIVLSIRLKLTPA